MIGPSNDVSRPGADGFIGGLMAPYRLACGAGAAGAGASQAQSAQTGERLTDRRFGCRERHPPPNPRSPALTFARHVAAFVRQSLADANHAVGGRGPSRHIAATR